MRYRLMYFGKYLGTVELVRGGRLGDLTLRPGSWWVADVVRRHWTAARADGGRLADSVEAGAAAADYRALCADAELVTEEGRLVPHLGLELATRPEELRLAVLLERGPRDATVL